MKKTQSILALTLTQCTLFSPLPLHAASYTGWKQETSSSGQKIWCYYQNGQKTCNTLLNINGKVYSFNDKGEMLTGLVNDNGYLYFFDSSGAAVYNAWRQINDKWYYFSEYRYALKDTTQTIDNELYKFNTDGTMFTGWTQSNNTWYFYRKNGSMAKNLWCNINGKWYRFDANGQMKTGWLTEDGKTYYLNSNGVMVTGSQTINNKEYTFKSDGSLISNSESADNQQQNNSTSSETTDTSTTKTKHYLTYEEYKIKANEFLSLPEYQNGVVWDINTRSKLFPEYYITACGAYAIDFEKYVFDFNPMTDTWDNPYKNEYNYADYSVVSNPNVYTEARAGDMLLSKNHAMIVIDRIGDTLIVAEGNNGGYVRVGNVTLHTENDPTGSYVKGLKILSLQHYLHVE